MFGSLRRDYFQRSPILVFPTFLFELPVGTINKGIEISLWFVIVNLIVHCQSQHTTCNVPINTRSDCVKSGLMLSPGNWEKVGRDNKLLATLSTAINTPPLPNHSFPIFNWEWVPSCATCNYEPLDRKESCRILQKSRRVFFVGDSVQGQWAKGFALDFFGGKLSSRNSPRVPYDRLDDEWDICMEELGRPVKVAFMRDDFLWSRHNESYSRNNWVFKTKTTRDRVTNHDWLKSPDLYSATKDIIVMSTGPHYHSVATFEQNIDTLARKLKGHLQDNAISTPLPILFRYATGGHPRCIKYKQPFTQDDFNKMWQAVEASPGKRAHYMESFAWHLMPSYNDIAMKAFSRYEVPIIKFDIESASHLRPDTHAITDCLHLKMPGLMDLWTLWFLNVLHSLDATTI